VPPAAAAGAPAASPALRRTGYCLAERRQGEGLAERHRWATHRLDLAEAQAPPVPRPLERLERPEPAFRQPALGPVRVRGLARRACVDQELDHLPWGPWPPVFQRLALLLRRFRWPVRLLRACLPSWQQPFSLGPFSQAP